MADAPPRHVGDVQEPVDPTEVDEGAVVGDVLHGPGERHALRENLERMLLLLLALLFEDGPPRQHDVAAPAVELDHLRADRLSQHRGQVLHGPQVDLGARQERLDADIDREAALHHLDDTALDGRALLVRAGDAIPHLDLVRLVLGEDDEPLVVLLGLQVHLDLVPDLG